MMRILLSVLAVVFMCQTAMSQMVCTKDGCFGSGVLAARLNARGVLQHDTSYSGPEVLFQSSGVATEEQAIAAWQQSPGHAALLPEITEIDCVGGVCVGRGSPLSDRPMATAVRSFVARPLARLLKARPLARLASRVRGCN